MFQVQSVTGSSIPFFSPLEASTPKCFRQQVPWTLSYSRQERYQPPHPPLLSRSEHVQHVKNGRSATCQKQQPFQRRRISRMPKTATMWGLFIRLPTWLHICSMVCFSFWAIAKCTRGWHLVGSRTHLDNGARKKIVGHVDHVLYVPCHLLIFYLVGGLEHVLLVHSTGNVIIPTDELIFFRGVGYTTNQLFVGFWSPGMLGRLVQT